MMSFEEYIECKKQKRYDELADEIVKKEHPHVPGTRWKLWEKELDQIKKTPSFCAMLAPFLEEDMQYQRLDPQRATKDADLVKEYEEYKDDERKKRSTECFGSANRWISCIFKKP